jgi:hypothetical protein
MILLQQKTPENPAKSGTLEGFDPVSRQAAQIPA